MNFTMPRISKEAATTASAVLALTVLVASLQWQTDRLATKATRAATMSQEPASTAGAQDISIMLVTDGAAATAVIDELTKATGSITAQLHQINRPELVQTLVTAAKSGVKVRLLLSRTSANYAKANVDALIAVGGQVAIDRSTEPTSSGSLIVIDERKMLAGSMWFGKNTARTLEHMVSSQQPKIVQATLAAINQRIAATNKP